MNMDADDIIRQVQIPAGYALVRLDCTLPKMRDESKGFLWLTAEEYKNAKYDFDKDGYRVPIYFVRRGNVIESKHTDVEV